MKYYQVLIVDDEPFITSSLSKSIPWEKHQCQICATATNGLDALTIIQTQHVDIVITDIRMQKMNGLELCQVIYEQFPQIQVIVISGYAEFSYAQRAIRYGILGYCLKPLEYEDIEIYLTRAVARLNETINKYSQDDLLNALLDEDITALNNYLKSVHLLSKQYYCGVFSGCNPPRSNPASETLVSLGKHQYGLISTAPLDVAAIKNFLAVPGNNGVGLSEHPLTLAELPNAMKDCQIKSLYYFIHPGCQINTELSEEASQAYLNQIATWLSIANSEQILSSLHELKSSEQKFRFSVRTAMRLNNMICSSSSYHMQEDTYYMYSIQQMVDCYPDFDSLIDNLCNQIMDPNPYPLDNVQITNLNFIRIMEFLNRNYCANISTNDLAEYVHLNPGYLSKIFKQETGTTITKYINNLRILKAKQMLNIGNYSISEIAAETGFNDYFYFLKTFKKITGMTPHQYKTENAVSDFEF